MAGVWTPATVERAIRSEVQHQGGDPYGPVANNLVATAKVESGLDPTKIGDNGHSVGLFQFNDRGAGAGHPMAWLLNPLNQIRDRVHAFLTANATTGTQAAAIQRPANRSAYARAVDGVRATLGLAPSSTASGTPFKWAPERDAVRALASHYHLTHTDGNRSPTAGYGAPNSTHSTARADVWADDYSGSNANMLAFAAAVGQQYPSLTVLPPGHEYSTGPNVHVNGPSRSANGTAGGGSNVSFLGDVFGAIIPGSGPAIAGAETGGALAGDALGAVGVPNPMDAVKPAVDNLLQGGATIIVTGLLLAFALALCAFGLMRMAGVKPGDVAMLAATDGGSALAKGAAL